MALVEREVRALKEPAWEPLNVIIRKKSLACDWGQKGPFNILASHMKQYDVLFK